MTIVPPKPTIGDRILNKLGKKRGMYLPENDDPFGQSDYHYLARKEPFFNALFRSKDKKLPEGMAVLPWVSGGDFDDIADKDKLDKD